MMERSTTNSLETFVQYLDSLRVSLLRLTLRPRLFRHLYSLAHWRLGLGMILSTVIYLPIAFIRPELLLAFGPMIFGYPHLIASYRFTEMRKYKFFVLMTILAITLHLSRASFFGVDQLPFGVWQIIVATLAFMVSHKRVLKILAALLVCAILIRLAWIDPLIYVGGALIVHNWVAFFYWILSSKETKRRTVAILSTLLFLLIHLLVLNGNLDSWIPMNQGTIDFKGSTQTTGWYLASWTTDSIVWYRFLVLYTFGLSVHYFVWLRAIPESLTKFEHPNRLSLSLKNLKEDLGMKTLILTLIIIAAGMIIWAFSFPLGSKIYFEIALLHGSLELMYLLDFRKNYGKST